MSNNSGGTMRILSVVLGCVAGIMSIVFSFMIASSASNAPEELSSFLGGLSFVVLFVGLIISVVSAMVLYGFAELIETTSAIAMYTRQLQRKSVPKLSINETSHTRQGICEMCGEHSDTIRTVIIKQDAETHEFAMCGACAQKFNSAAD